MLPALLLTSCTAAPAAGSVILGTPEMIAHSATLAAAVRPWSRGDEVGRLVVARVPAASVSVLTTNTPTPLQELLPEGDLVAINGGFYDGAGAAMGLSISGTVQVSPLRKGGGSGVLLLTEEGARIVHRDSVGSLYGVRDAVQSIDRLASGGRVLVSDKASTDRDARSAVAVTREGDLLLAILFAEEAVESERDGVIQLDADSTTSGVSLKEWAGLMVQLGGVDVLNLDGGYSTSMRIDLDGNLLDVRPHGAAINAVVAR